MPKPIEPKQDRWPCPWQDCGRHVPVKKDRSLRSHRWDGRTCPGGGFNIGRPALAQEAAMAERYAVIWPERQ
jgi:hypothetical protein